MEQVWWRLLPSSQTDVLLAVYWALVCFCADWTRGHTLEWAAGIGVSGTASNGQVAREGGGGGQR